MQEIYRKYHFPPGNNLWRSLLTSFAFLQDPIGTISENMSRYSGTYSVRLFGIGKVILTEDPEFIEYVLKDHHSNFAKSELSTKTAARLFGKGLLFSNGGVWLKQRRLIQPAFHHAKIQTLLENISNTGSEHIKAFPEGQNIDIYDLMHKLSFSVLIRSLFDIQLSPEMIKVLSESFTDIQDFLLKDVNQPYRKLFYPFNQSNKKVVEKSRMIRRIVNEIIQKRRNESEMRNDLLDMLLQARHEDSGAALSEQQITDEILVLLFAGHETTANTLSWILYLLASHPEKLEKLEKRLSKINLYDSTKEEFLNAVISESMRLYPAAWMTERVALEDDRFGEFHFPKGTIIIPFFYGLHRNRNYWEDESIFNPERFMFPDPAKSKKVKNYFPFGAGPRMCIGNNFAMAEMAIILFLILKEFNISPAKEKPGMWPLITLRPRGLFLHLKRR